MLSNVILNLALVVPLAHAGLALATSLSAFINAGLLLFTLRKLGVYRPRAGWGRLGLKLLFANACMLTVLVVAHGELDAWLAAEFWSRLARLAVVIVAGGGSYLVAMFVVGLRPRSLLDR